MPRDIPVGNGNILINFDTDYFLRDIYFPHVGQENHTVGHRSWFGVWADGKFAWINDGWDIQRKYMKETLVTDVILTNQKLNLELTCHDTVDALKDIYVREVKVRDLSNKNRKVRLFFHHDFHISENEVGDTAFFDPRTDSVVHYKKRRWFLINSASSEKFGIHQWSIGNKEVNGHEGTFRDSEDGELGKNPIAQGSVDSTICTEVNVPAGGAAMAHYWICFGKSYEEVTELNKHIYDNSPGAMVARSQNYWRLWANADPVDFQGLPQAVIDLYKRSLLVIRTQIDNGGAIIAANDHDITQFARDTYSYMWPRDGALVAHALTRAGFRDTAMNFFNFCNDVINEEGYLMHKYNPDKSLASSWHPWVRNGQLDLPIQEDETALVVWSLWQTFKKFRNVERMSPLFSKLLRRGAKFMLDFRDQETKLPKPSYDLWEERYGVHLFTVGATIGGLRAAAAFAQAMGEKSLQESCHKAADEMVEAMNKHLWNEEKQRFCRMATRTETGYDLDMTIDAAMYGIFAFGALPPNDPKVKATMQAIRDRLWIKTEVGGVARYENDYYHQVSKDVEKIPGNPWFICTMWLAQYDIASAKSADNLRDAGKILEWVAAHALPSGCLAEQVHPLTNAPLSVAPLTWSHAVFVTTVLDYLEKRKQLQSEAVFAYTVTPV